jgi:heme/copper-type cytochrome/quinol oxidase subunit 3
MTTKDHNETLVGIHLFVGSVFTLGLIGSPWIIARNFRDEGMIPQAILVFGIVLLIAALMFSTAIAMRRQKPAGRRLGLIAAAVMIIIFWPAGVYSWWFFHSEGAKRLYGVKLD